MDHEEILGVFKCLCLISLSPKGIHLNFLFEFEFELMICRV